MRVRKYVKEVLNNKLEFKASVYYSDFQKICEVYVQIYVIKKILK